MSAGNTEASRAAFEAWLHSPDCPIPAGTQMISDLVRVSRAAWQASRQAALEDAGAELTGMSCNNSTARSAIKVCIETIKDMK